MITQRQRQLFDECIDLCIQKTRRNVAILEDSFPSYPFYANERSWSVSGEDDWKDPDRGYWTAGYWPGILWLCYRLTGDRFFKDNARRWLVKLASRCAVRLSHDVGFIFFPAYVLGYEITEDEEDMKVTAKRAAYTLVRLFDRGKGCIPVADREGLREMLSIETMLCLPLLCWAGRLSDVPDATAFSEKHAQTTFEKMIRPDGSTRSLCVIGAGGEVLRNEKGRAFDVSSCWARGHAFALSGAAQAFFFTGESIYADMLKRLLSYYETYKQGDGIPFWDYGAPDIPEAEKDTTSAAAMSQALLLLSHKRLESEYAGCALDMLETLSESYFADVENPGLLKKAKIDGVAGTGTVMSSVCADFYYLFSLFLTTRAGADLAAKLAG